MRNILMIFCLLTICFSARSQVIVETSSIPEIGDVLRYTPFTEFEDSLSYRSVGEDLSWSYDDFNLGEVVEESYLDIEGTAIGDSFPDANMIIGVGIFEAAAVRSDTSIAIIGVLTGDFSGLGLETASVVEEPYHLRLAPFNYGDELEDEISFRIQFSSALIPGLDTFEIPGSSLDSVRFSATVMKTEQATAWGSLDILGESYDVLKVKQVDQTNVRIEVGVNSILGFFWLDATDLIGDVVSAFNQSSTTYKFLSSDSKRSIVEFRETRLNDSMINVSGRISEEIISGISSTMDMSGKLQVYPNPSNDYISILNSHAVDAGTMVTIYGADGKVYQRFPSYTLENQISVQRLPVGQYFIHLISEGQSYVQLFSKVR